MKYIYIISLWILLNINLLSAGLSPAGLDSLLVKNYAPALGMGEAYTSIEGDTGSFFYNPASLARIDHLNIGLNHCSGLFGTGIEFLALAMPLGFGSLGLGMNYYYLPSDPILDPEGSFIFEAKNWDLMVIAGLGKDIKELGTGLRTGINVKWGMQKMADQDHSFLAVDLGALYEIMKDLFTGFSLRDLGSFPRANQAENASPGNFNVGLSYRLFDSSLLASFDFSYYFYQKTFEKIGLEYDLFDILKIRAGYKLGYDIGNLSAGLGLNYRIKSLSSIIRINYAFNLNTTSSVFGQVHSLNLELLLPKLSSSKGGERVITEKKEEGSGETYLLSLARFRNKEKKRDLDYLREEIPVKTSEMIGSQNKDIKMFDILEQETQPTLESLEKTRVRYILGGEYVLKGDLLSIQYFIVDVKTRSKVFEDSLEANIRTSRINQVYDELAGRVVKKIREMEKK